MEYKFILCPCCGKKLFKVTSDSRYKNIYIWCKNCKKEVLIKEPLSQGKQTSLI